MRIYFKIFILLGLLLALISFFGLKTICSILKCCIMTTKKEIVNNKNNNNSNSNNNNNGINNNNTHTEAALLKN